MNPFEPPVADRKKPKLWDSVRRFIGLTMIGCAGASFAFVDGPWPVRVLAVGFGVLMVVVAARRLANPLLKRER